VEHKDGLGALESRLVECAVAGEELDCAPTGTSAAELEEIDDWDDRGSALRSLSRCVPGSCPIGLCILGGDFGCVAHISLVKLTCPELR
jgi:hypothetical protein